MLPPEAAELKGRAPQIITIVIANAGEAILRHAGEIGTSPRFQQSSSQWPPFYPMKAIWDYTFIGLLV
jgi:hypothetical protein